MSHPNELRRRFEVQGFSGLRASELESVGRWMRFTPTMNLLVAAAGTVLGSPPLLLLLAGFMALGVGLPGHPWDYLYNALVRRWTGTRALPASGWRRRLTFSIGAPWLAATAWCFSSGHDTPGRVLGGVMVALMAPLATVHWCIVSEMVD